MKKIRNISILSITIIFMFASCSVQKRQYMSGFHIEGKNKKHKSSNEYLAKNSTQNKNNKNQIETGDLSLKVVQPDIKIGKNNKMTEAPLIASTNKSIILPVSNRTLIEKNSVKTISNKFKNTSDFKLVKKKNLKKSSSTTGGGKNQIVALLICFFLGLLGVHRFYLGYAGLGVLYLFTFGIFGIGWLIDLILLIIPNGLTPKGKSSYKD